MLTKTPLCIAVGLLLALVGCRTPDPSIELLESELRWMEDNLYMLDDQLERCCEQLESARRNNAALRTQLREQRSSGPKPTPANRQTPPDQPFDEESTEELLSIPQIEINESADELPNAGNASGGGAESMQLPDGQIELRGTPEVEPLRKSKPEMGPASGDPFQDVDEDDGRVTRILLNKRLTGGYDFDGEPGHDGLVVVIEPQNSFNEYVARAGRIRVEATDPAASGVDGQVARWDFDPIEAAAFLKNSLLGRGIHLKLPWPAAPPPQRELLLSVVYETTDGRQLRAEKKMLLTPATEAMVARTPAGHSTPRSSAPAWSPTR